MNTVAQRGLLDSLAKEKISHAKLEPGKTMKKITLEPLVIAQPAPLAGEPLAESLALKDACTIADLGPFHMDGVHVMESDKQRRHEETWQVFQAEAEQIMLQMRDKAGDVSSRFKQQLDESDMYVEGVLSNLADDKVMLLEEDGVRDLWEKVIEQAEPRRKWITGLAADLEAVEALRKEEMDALMERALEVLVEVRHVSEGEIERSMEQESLQVNVAVLENRRVHAELVRRLGVQEVVQEKERRERWVEGMQRWRMLRTRHTIATFKARILSEEFQEPPPRVAIINGLKGDQGQVHSRLVEHLGVASGLVPPVLSTENVLKWVEESTAILDGWAASYEGRIGEVQAFEDQLQELEVGLISTLRADVARYGAMGEEETEVMLQEECMVLVTARREAAAALLESLSDYVAAQAGSWRDTAARMGEFVRGCARLMETQHQSIKDLDAQAAQDLKGCRDQFNEDDAHREELLEAALTALRQGGSERALDERQAKALSALDDIEEGYRGFHKGMVAIAKKHPVDHKELADQYERDLCTYLRLKFNVDPLPEPEPEEPEEGAAEEEAPPPPAAKAAPAKGGKKGAPEPEPEPEDEEEAEPEPEEPPPPPVLTGKGTAFQVAVDIYEDVFLRSPDEEANAGGEGGEGEGEGGEDGGEPPKEPEPAKDGEEGEEGGEPEPEPEPPYEGPPLDPSGEPYVLSLPVEESLLRGVLEKAQVALLDEKEELGAEVEDRTAAWAQMKEENLTAELDTSLRRHRPRAGRVEEEVRLSRSIELVEQERRHNRHMRATARAFKGQQAQYDTDLAAAREDMLSAIKRMTAAEGYLSTASSCKTLEVRQREAGKLRAKIDTAVQARAEEMQREVQAFCDALVAANEMFESENLRNFDEGGLYAPGSIARYRKQIKQAGDAATGLLALRQREVSRLEREMLAGSQAAHDSLESVVPFHREDLALLEGIDKALDSTRFKLHREFERSDEAAAAIGAKLEELRAIADTPEEEARARGEGGAAAALKCVDELRGLVRPRAAFLEYLSGSVGAEAVDLSLDPPPGEGDEGGAAAAAPAKGGKGGAGGKGDGKGAAAAPAKGDAGQAEEGELPTLMGTVGQLMEGSKEALAGVGETYYEEKSAERAITRPKRIPEAVDELNARNAAMLEEFGEQAQAHLAAARTELRKQVITAAEVLARVPAVALQGLLAEHVGAAEAELASLSRKNERARRPLLSQQDVHRDSLRPWMGNPNRQDQLEELCAKEVERAHISVDNLWQHVGACTVAVGEKAGTFSGRFQRAVSLLLQLLDSSVLPDDLPPIGEDADQIRLLTRKNIKQLKWLDEQGLGHEIEYRDREGRTYKERDWPALPLDTLSLEAAGWTGEEELREALGEVQEPAEGEEEAAAADKGAAEEEAPAPLSALDTPCQHAVVAARDRCFKLYRKSMHSWVSAAKRKTLTSLKQEMQWKSNWGHLVQLVRSGESS